MGRTGGWVASCLDHHLDTVSFGCEHALIDEARSGDAGLVPADSPAGGARPMRIKIGDHGHFQSRNGWHLTKEHRAELACTDQGTTHGLSGITPGCEK
jgi:hypothetical protein